MAAKLMNDICRCTGEAEIDNKVQFCPARDKCLRYLEREIFRGRVIMTAPSILNSGCSSLITREDTE